MEPYLKRCNGDVDRALRLYTWNVEISAALSSPLWCLEVVLRNAVHDRLVAMTGQSAWWHDRRVDLHDEAKGLLAKVGKS